MKRGQQEGARSGEGEQTTPAPGEGEGANSSSRSARPVKWWEIIAVIAASMGLLWAGWALAHLWAVPKFWSGAAVIVLGSATVAQLVVERWAGDIGRNLDEKSKTKRIRRDGRAKKEIDHAKKENESLFGALATTVLWFAVVTTVALGANLAGEAVEAKLTCYKPDSLMSSLVPTWQADAVCEMPQ